MLLKFIATRFIRDRWTKEFFTEVYDSLDISYKDYLSERNEQGGYCHKSMRSAMRSIKAASPWLFTTQEYESLNIPNTTNNIDGGVNPKLKELVRNHRGMNIQRRNKLLQVLLASLGQD